MSHMSYPRDTVHTAYKVLDSEFPSFTASTQHTSNFYSEMSCYQHHPALNHRIPWDYGMYGVDPYYQALFPYRSFHGSATFFPRAFKSFYVDEEKPNQSYIGLIGQAIMSSGDKKMVLSDIYKWVLTHYPYFRNKGPGWKNSVRHNLSLNECFVKAGRSPNGKGNYWAINPENFEDFRKGDFRRRRAQRRNRKSEESRNQKDEVENNLLSTTSGVDQETVTGDDSINCNDKDKSRHTSKEVVRVRAFDVENLLRDKTSG